MTAIGALDRFINLWDFELAAEAALEPMAWRYFSRGAGDERTPRENRLAFERHRLRPRVLVDVGCRSLATTVLGRPTGWPVLVAPMAFHGLACEDAEAATARAAAAEGTVLCVSTMANLPLEQVRAAAPGATQWFQLYVQRDRGVTAELVRRAAAAGYEALVVTADAPALGRREADLRHGFSLPDGAKTRGYLPLVNEVPNSHANSIPMDGLVKWMTELSAKHLLVVLDSCFSGLAIDGIDLKGPEETVDAVAFARAAGGPARFLLMAGTAGQKSVAGRDWNGSLFTDSILRGLSTVDRVDIFNNRIITTRGLYVWLKEAVSGESTKVGRPMTPLFKDLSLNGASQGDFVFVRAK